MKHDLFLSLIWWLYLMAIGWAFLPLAMRLFTRFWDKGYLFSKILGLSISAYTVWIAVSLNVFPFSRISSMAVLVGLSIVIWWRFHGFSRLQALLQHQSWRRTFFIEEALFLTLLLAWTYLRGIHPDLIGQEKFMDLGFVNAILRAETMPPPDMWLAGQPINYYYFGHFITAFLIQLTQIASPISYNLMIATLFALTFSLTFSLTSNLLWINAIKKWHCIVGGSVSALLMTMGGNLHTVVYAYLRPLALSWGWIQGKAYTYWYPDATRFIGYWPPKPDKTIHEFPHYSFIVSDLHAHVIDIPQMLLLLALLGLYCCEPDGKQSAEGRFTFNPLIYALGFLLGIAGITNLWDYAIYFMVVAAVITAKRFQQLSSQHSWYRLLWQSLVGIGLVLITSLAIQMPFMLNFNNFSQGFGFTTHHSSLYQLFILWGYQSLLVLSFLAALGWLYKQRTSSTKLSIGARYFLNLDKPDLLMIVLSLAAFSLLIVPEFLYVKDIYGDEYQRANTMFKLTYQAFILFSIIIGYGVLKIANVLKQTLPRLQFAVWPILIALLICPLLYPYWAITSYYGIPTSDRYKGLDGTQFLQEQYLGDYQAIQWMNETIKGQPVILEANGESYTAYDRISVFTGLPTVLGWRVHEWLHRGFDIPRERAADVQILYESPDNTATVALIRKYNIQYLIIGAMEHEKFPHLNLQKWLHLGTIVFNANGTQVLKLDPSKI